jgi:hypothetical protein
VHSRPGFPFNLGFSGFGYYAQMIRERHPQQRRHGSLTVVASGSVPCTLMEVSPVGATLQSNRSLPQRFYVMLRPDLKRWCEVIWRQRGQVGVRFIHDPTAQGQIKHLDL